MGGRGRPHDPERSGQTSQELSGRNLLRRWLARHLLDQSNAGGVPSVVLAGLCERRGRGHHDQRSSSRDQRCSASPHEAKRSTDAARREDALITRTRFARGAPASTARAPGWSRWRGGHAGCRRCARGWRGRQSIPVEVRPRRVTLWWPPSLDHDRALRSRRTARQSTPRSRCASGLWWPATGSGLRSAVGDYDGCWPSWQSSHS